MRGQPRDIMAAFWSLVWIAGAGAALWFGWYLDDFPMVNCFLRGGFIMAIASSLLSLFLALRGPGRGRHRRPDAYLFSGQVLPHRPPAHLLVFSIFGRGRGTTGIPLGYEWDTRTGRYGPAQWVFEGKRGPHSARHRPEWFRQGHPPLDPRPP